MPDVNSDYNTIISALHSNDHNLLAYTEDGHFKELGWLGRTWRVLTGFLKQEEEPFKKDCYVPNVCNRVEKFVQDNKAELTPDQKTALIDSLRYLRDKRLKLNHYVHNIALAIQNIDAIQVSGQKPHQ